MNFTVVIPYGSGGDPDRAAAFDFVARWWRSLGLPVLVGRLPETTAWSKGAAVDSVIDRAKTDGLIIADADALLTREGASDALRAVAHGSAWAQPHGRVLRLARNETKRVYRLGVDVLPRLGGSSRPAPPGGGIVVLSREAYDTVGGIDPRFHGWGGEDISFARALDTLAGYGIRFGGTLWHLYHQRTPRRLGNRASDESERLAGRYLDAENDPDAMRELVWERTLA